MIIAVSGVVLICYILSLLTILPFASAQIGTTTNTPPTTSTSTTNSAQQQTGTDPTTVTMVQGAQDPNNKQFFSPREVTVSPGSTVTWKNEDTTTHTAYSGKAPTPVGKFDTSFVGRGESSKPITMPAEPGDYSFFCTIHPWMTGKIKVG
jgi:nitrite reductase (NO-forming)